MRHFHLLKWRARLGSSLARPYHQYEAPRAGSCLESVGSGTPLGVMLPLSYNVKIIEPVAAVLDW